MKADMYGEIEHIKLHRKMVELLISIAPTVYLAFVMKYMNSQFYNSDYGKCTWFDVCWISVLEKLPDTLLAWGFIVNSHNSCVAN